RPQAEGECMATRTFLKTEGVPGDSKVRKHAGWIEVLWWVSTSNALSKEGLTPSKPDRTRIRFGIRKEGTASGKLYLASTGKLRIGGAATLGDVVDEGGGEERARITMKDGAVAFRQPPDRNKGTQVMLVLEYGRDLPQGGFRRNLLRPDWPPRRAFQSRVFDHVEERRGLPSGRGLTRDLAQRLQVDVAPRHHAHELARPRLASQGARHRAGAGALDDDVVALGQQPHGCRDFRQVGDEGA